MTYTDLFSNEDEDVIQLNVLEKFRIEDESFDNALALNLLEHLPSIENFKHEVFRILKKDGQLIIAVSYFFPYHPDSEDYFRYSDTLLIKEFEEVGFVHKRTMFPTIGPFSTFTDYLLIISLPSKIRIILKPIFMLLAFVIDKIVMLYRPTFNHRPTNETFASGYVIVFDKKIQ
jgi:SAM-dependent methyltransferase